MVTVTVADQLAAVAVHVREGRPYFVVVDDIPQPWRDQFRAALYSSACPVIDGYDWCAYAWDWAAFVRSVVSSEIVTEPSSLSDFLTLLP
jgi:hypothetical protein